MPTAKLTEEQKTLVKARVQELMGEGTPTRHALAKIVKQVANEQNLPIFKVMSAVDNFTRPLSRSAGSQDEGSKVYEKIKNKLEKLEAEVKHKQINELPIETARYFNKVLGDIVTRLGL